MGISTSCRKGEAGMTTHAYLAVCLRQTLLHTLCQCQAVQRFSSRSCLQAGTHCFLLPQTGQWSAWP
jgi:hypothetical protein